MSEQAQPLSRRERREMEEAARMAEGDETQALPIAPETESVVSRRERRRMERLAHPVETWTAEEEMIATGQMPAMTNEVLAEQERLARERSEQAQAFEAAAAAAYEQTAPEPESSRARADAEPVSRRRARARASARARAELWLSPSSRAQPPRPPQTTAASPPTFATSSPRARCRRARSRHRTPLPALKPRRPMRLRRFADSRSKPMAGLSRATTGSTPVVAGADFEPGEFVAPEPQRTSRQPQAASARRGIGPRAPRRRRRRGPVERANGGRAGAIAALPDAASEAEPVDLADAPAEADVPAVAEPHEGEPAGNSPVWSALVPATPTARPALAESVEPVGQAAAQPVANAAPSVWDTHPLTNPGASPVRELPAEPVKQELPRPDLTALLATQAGPGVGQAAVTSTEATTATGAVLRPLPEPQAGGGARHFRWVHLAVIGAIAFVLGVLAWNIARSGS